MYKDFYELKQNPFDITPDPASFFSTPRHNEALANLAYGVRWRKGFIVLTGEVGTGKTLLLACLMDLLRRTQIACAHVVNPRLTSGEFLRYVAADLQVPTRARDKSELLLDFNKFLIDRCRRGSTTVLIVDEAHLIDWEVLEEIRLLGNLETAQEKLLQTVLVGQPELARNLDSPELRQLKQRVMLRCELQSLRENEIEPYIERRLAVAGARPENIAFHRQSIDLIYEYSVGIPRTINTICESALVIGFAQRLRTIVPRIIEEVAADFHLRAPRIFPKSAERMEFHSGEASTPVAALRAQS